MNIDALRRKTGITKKELAYLEGLASLYQHHPELKDATVIGGLAAKLLISKQRGGNVRPITDIDLYLPQLPESLDRLVTETPLVEVASVRFKHAGIDQKEQLSDATCYKLQTDFPYDVDIFSGSVGQLHLTSIQGLSEVPTIPLELEHEEYTGRVKLAHPGLLLSLYLNPGAINEKRINRARHLLASLDDGTNPLLEGVTLKEVEDVFTQLWNGQTELGDTAETRRLIEHYSPSKSKLYAFMKPHLER